MTRNRTLPLLLALSALLVPTTSAFAAKAGPRSVQQKSPAAAPALPVARPAPEGPVRIPIDLVLRTMENEGEEDFEFAPDDRPGSPVFDARDFVPPARAWSPLSSAAFGANVRINTLSGTPATNAEAEVTIAASGQKLISAWNDGQFWQVQPGFVGYGYSTNGGATWTDGGSLTNLGVTDVFYGDPVLAVDPAGHWYMADLWRPSSTVTGISVSHGTFAGAAPVWDPPAVIATHPADYLDKPWIAVDPASGTVYIAYIRFFSSGGQQLEFSRSTNHGATWSAPVALTTSSTSSPMSPRLQVGPSGEVFLAYYAYNRLDGSDYLRVRRSLDNGASFGPEYAIGGRPFLNNYFSGPAGYNRERVVAQVSIDVDRSSSPRRGNLYAVWQEGLDIFSDNLGGAGAGSEMEPNESSIAATPFTPGQTLSGSLSSTADADWWSFSGTAGQTIVLYLAPNASSCNGYLRMFAGGGTTSNRCALSHFSGGVAIVQYTLPSSGTYYFRVLNWDGVAGNIGNYRVYTALHAASPADIARDHRDVMLSRSADGGATWSLPRVVNDELPRFDDTWPEVAVDAAGRVHVAWYDHRDDPAAGIGTSMYYARSDDGGASFVPSARFSTGGAVNWNAVASNSFPNMGDYSALVADGMNVYANWADGRNGTPDSYFARVVDATSAVEPPAPRAELALSARGLTSQKAGVLRVLLTLPRAGTVNLDVLDPAGRRVSSTAWESAGQGAHAVEVGDGLAAGIYFVRVSQGAEHAATRAIALR